MAGAGRCNDALHHPGVAVGERLQREFQGSLRDEPLNGEIFYSLAEARVLIEAWRRHYNTVRPRSSLGYRPPAPEAAPSHCRLPVPLRSTSRRQWRRRRQCTNNQPGPLSGGQSATIGASREAGVTTGGNVALDGLVGALVGAGARSVVASHWPVSDDYDATKRLIGGLLDAAPGVPSAQALEQAQES